MADSEVRIFDYDKIEIGEKLGSYEYILTQEMLDNFRASIGDPDAVFPTLAVKHDATAFAMVYEDNTGGVNAGNEVEFFNPPIPGKKIRVSGRIADKYLRRDKPYMVIEATAIDEDGRLLEKLRTYQMKKAGRGGQEMASTSIASRPTDSVSHQERDPGNHQPVRELRHPGPAEHPQQPRAGPAAPRHHLSHRLGSHVGGLRLREPPSLLRAQRSSTTQAPST